MILNSQGTYFKTETGEQINTNNTPQFENIK